MQKFKNVGEKWNLRGAVELLPSVGDASGDGVLILLHHSNGLRVHRLTTLPPDLIRTPTETLKSQIPRGGRAHSPVPPGIARAPTRPPPSPAAAESTETAAGEIAEVDIEFAEVR